MQIKFPKLESSYSCERTLCRHRYVPNKNDAFCRCGAFSNAYGEDLLKVIFAKAFKLVISKELKQLFRAMHYTKPQQDRFLTEAYNYIVDNDLDVLREIIIDGLASLDWGME